MIYSAMLKDIFIKEYIENKSELCDGENHPIRFNYNKYRKGKNRCSYCGAKIGKVNLNKTTLLNKLKDNCIQHNPVLNYLLNKGD